MLGATIGSACPVAHYPGLAQCTCACHCVCVRQQASCSATEAGEKLAKALEAADRTQKALQEERSNSTRLQEQLQALQEQLAQVGKGQDAQHPVLNCVPA